MKRATLFLSVGIALGVAGMHVASRFGTEPPAQRDRNATMPAAAALEAPDSRAEDALATLERALDAGVAGPALDAIVSAATSRDVAAVARLLSESRNAPQSDRIAASVLRALGAGPEGLDFVVDVLTGSANDAERRIRIIAALAETDPHAAAALAASLADPAERTRAETRVIAAWTETDPLAAIAHIDATADPLRRNELLRTSFLVWSLTDPRGALREYARLESAGMTMTVITLGIMELLARQDPEGFLSLPVQPNSVLSNGQRTALATLAERNPDAALDYAARLDGMNPQTRLAAVAEGWARRDASAALAWARRQGAAATSLEATIYAVIAETEPMRAIDLVLSMDASADARAEAMRTVMARAMAANPASSARIAEAALAFDDPALRQHAVQGVMTSWRSLAPKAAIDWLVANADRVPEAAFRQILTSFSALGGLQAGLDAATAASYATRIPASVRADWIAAVGVAYARENPLASIEWIESLRGEPGYTAGVTSVALGVAETDPRAAIGLVEGAGLDGNAAATTLRQIAQLWARQAPQAAMTWARGLSDAQARASSEEAIVRVWASERPDEARAFVLGMPAGPDRDAALRALVGAGVHDAAVLRAFASDNTRDMALMSLIGSIGDSDAARELIDHIASPSMRAAAEQNLERASRVPRVVISGGRVISLPAEPPSR